MSFIVLLVITVGGYAGAADRMPVAQQNALVKKYCAVCHTDAADNGGLSLEHFDAATAPPSLKAMLLSKLTGGVALHLVTDPSAAALVNRKAKSGAMGAAGLPIPDKATVDAFMHPFAVGSNGATEWTVERAKDHIRASALREVLSTADVGEARAYRLIVSCNREAHKGFVQLAWSPLPQSGTLAASADGKTAKRFAVDGSEKMGNGSGVVSKGLAAMMLDGMTLPAQSLTISELFAGEKVVFSFANLPAEARHHLEPCFNIVQQ